MWKVKRFRTLAAQNAWIETHAGNYQIVVIFMDNGYAVEYRRLRHVY